LRAKQSQPSLTDKKGRYAGSDDRRGPAGNVADDDADDLGSSAQGEQMKSRAHHEWRTVTHAVKGWLRTDDNHDAGKENDGLQDAGSCCRRPKIDRLRPRVPIQN